jgi:hypothetical protein
MGSIAISAIEAAAARALLLLGAGAAAGTADEALRRRQKEADQARSSPIARTDAQTKAREKCKECPPDKGAPALRNTAGWSDDSITYQMRIAQMPPAPVGYLTEWKFSAVDFDGFDSRQCMLKEAKAKYDQFFDDFRQVRGWWTEGADKMIEEAYRQAAVALPRPPVQLRWHFMEPLSYRYFSKIIKAAYPDIEVVYQP